MMNVSHLYARTTVSRLLSTQTSKRLLLIRAGPVQRSYATSVPHTTGHHQSSPGYGQPHHNRLYLLLAAIGVPAAFYLSRRGSRHHMEPIATFDERHGIDTHVTEGSPGQGKDATYDEPRAWGAPKGPHTISFKQEGLSDTDALHPYMNATGKSQKGEGDIETAKVKGAVSPNRPQV